MLEKTFFKELVNIRTNNELYNQWLQYLLNLSEDDIREIIDKGLTYQADALYSMIKELNAGQPKQVSLLRKISRIKKLTHTKADLLR